MINVTFFTDKILFVKDTEHVPSRGDRIYIEPTQLQQYKNEDHVRMRPELTTFMVTEIRWSYYDTVSGVIGSEQDQTAIVHIKPIVQSEKSHTEEPHAFEYYADKASGMPVESGLYLVKDARDREKGVMRVVRGPRGGYIKPRWVSLRWDEVRWDRDWTWCRLTIQEEGR